MKLILVSAMSCLIAVNSANAIGCVSGAALGGVVGHMKHHTFLGMFGGCAGGMVVHRMYSHWKRTHPNGTMGEFVSDYRDKLPDGWADRLSGGTHAILPAGDK